MKGKARLRVQERNGQDSHDAYWNRSHPKDLSYCKKCRAIYHNKHWTFDETRYAALSADAKAHETTCPACEKIGDRFASGTVLLSGAFLKGHQEEILNLVKNEEKRAMGMNPLERIIDIAARGEELEVTTTHERLAQRIGKSLHRAFSGTVDYRWSRGEKMARVSWCRD